jgi:DNA-binding beta-propeller fold protein YncE
VRRIDVHGTITTVAGTGAAGFSGDGGPATKAAVDDPAGLAVGANGSLFLADSNNHRVRRVDTKGVITTVAGTGDVGDSGDGGLAMQAQMKDPEALLLTPAGDLLVPDPEADCIRRIRRDGRIFAFAGTSAPGDTGDGGPATMATFQAAGSPFALALAPDGAVYVADSGNRAIRIVAADGMISTAGR